MNKQEKIIVAILFAALAGWMVFMPSTAPQPPASGVSGTNVNDSVVGSMDTNTVQDAAFEAATNTDPAVPALPEIVPAAPTVVAEAATGVTESQVTAPQIPASVHTLANEKFEIDISSRGAGAVEARLLEYAQGLEPDSGPRTFDFHELPALSIDGVDGFGADAAFVVKEVETGKSLVLTRQVGPLQLTRKMHVDEGYHLFVTETWRNTGAESVLLPHHRIQIGAMKMGETNTKQMGPALPFLGIDTLAAKGGEKVRHWGSKGFMSGELTLVDLFQEDERRGGFACNPMRTPMTRPLPQRIADMRSGDTDWIAVKTKFFTQILSMEQPVPGFVLQAERTVRENEDPENSRTWVKAADLTQVAAQARLNDVALEPGESTARKMMYYVGPKQLSLLEELGNHQEDVMEFRRLTIICRPLLKGLNFFEGIFGNFGIAIIMLTVVIKVIFWPITHKSTEQMKRMGEIQPLTKEIQAKYKSQPERMQKELMKLYKEKKVNPMAGCLPMVVQIPVFIGLFTVLRSAVELRYATFLWIPDLSEPEGLFSAFFANIPLIPSLNILPLFMTGLTVLQQRLTPTTGDPQQQKMMQMMPIIFLFILYNMASGLVLYWSINQLLSIVQLLMQQRSREKKKAAAA